MKIRNKEVMSIVAIALAAQTMMFNNAYATGNQINEDKIESCKSNQVNAKKSRKKRKNKGTQRTNGGKKEQMGQVENK